MEGGKFNMSDVRYVVKCRSGFVRSFELSKRKFMALVDTVVSPADAMFFRLDQAYLVVTLLSGLGRYSDLSVVLYEEADHDV